MDWKSAKHPDDFPLSTSSLLGNWIKIELNHNSRQSIAYQYALDFKYEWLFNPPTIYSDLWTKSNKTHKWTWGEAGSLDETVRLLEKGMPPAKFLKAYEQACKELEPIVLSSAPTLKRKRIYNMDDGEPDIDVALSGVEDYLLRKNKVLTKDRIVHLAWQMAHNCNESEDTFARQAAAAVAVTNKIEQYGYRVKLTGYWGLHAGGMNYCEAKNIPKPYKDHLDEVLFSLPIKQENQLLDEYKVLALGMPGILRHFIFAWVNSVFGSDLTHLSSGMGRAMFTDAFKIAATRENIISVIVTSDAPGTMRTLIEEL